MIFSLLSNLVNPDGSISGGTNTYLQEKAPLIAFICVIVIVAIIATCITSEIIRHLRKNLNDDSKLKTKKYDILNTVIPLILIAIYITFGILALKAI